MRDGTRGLRRWLAAGLCAALALAGCGGGGGGAPGEEPGGEGGTMSLAARTQAVDDLSAQFERITAGRRGTQADLQQLRDWVLRQDAFVDSGVGDRLLWARFRYGRHFVFQAALAAQGLGTLIGWDGNSNPHAYRAVGLLVDRMAGVNKFEPVTPGNRAFNFADVWQHLDRNGLTITPGVDGGAAAPMVRFGAGFTKLAPVVRALQARGDKLVIYGDLGTEPGTVTVGGVPVAATWAADGSKAEATLANATHGEVVVKVKDRTSNPRVLGDWRGSVTYRRESVEVTGCGGAKFHNTMVVDLHLRADMHAVRDRVDGPLKNNPHYLIPAPDTKATWSAGGVCALDGEVHTQWSGSGDLAFNTSLVLEDQHTPPTGNIMMARIDAVQKRFQLNMVADGKPRTNVAKFGKPLQQPLLFDIELYGFLNLGPDFTKLLPSGTFLPCGTGVDLAGGRHRQAHDVLPLTMDIRWSGMGASPACDDGIGR